MIVIVVQYDQEDRPRAQVIMDGDAPKMFVSIEAVESHREGHEWHNRVWWAVDVETGEMREALPF